MADRGQDSRGVDATAEGGPVDRHATDTRRPPMSTPDARTQTEEATDLEQVPEGPEQQAEKASAALKQVFESVLQIHLREARVRSGLAYRLGRTLIAHVTAPLQWPRLPFALWKEYSRFRREARDAAIRGKRAPLAPLALVAGAEPLALVLTEEPQSIRVPRSANTREVWCTAIVPEPEAHVDVDLSIASGGADALRAVLGGPVRSNDRLPRRQVCLRAMVASCLLELEGGDEVSFELSIAHAGLCVVRLELREGNSNSSAGLSSSDGAHPTTNAPIAGAYIAAELDKKLWGGYAKYALPELERLELDPTADVVEREDAAWFLVRWYLAHGQPERALQSIDRSKRLRAKQHPRVFLSEAQCLIKLGRLAEAKACLDEASRATGRIDFQLLASSVVRRLEETRGATPQRAESAQLEIINMLLERARLAPIEKAREEEPLSISNLRCRASARVGDQSEKVSVIVPAYNATATIGWVLGAILEQTWRNIEVLVIDDCSTDSTREIVRAIASADDRVRLIEHDANRGAYSARNTGVRHATGDLIMVHDADDWSHPQRIELQMEALRANPKLIGVKTHWVRVTQSLDIVGEWIARGTLFDLNYSSFLFRKDLLDAIGPWDEVAVSGDGEFFSRVRAVYGEQSVLRLPPSYLVAFSLAREDSLTRGNATHLRSLFYGLRWHYKDAYLAWHARLKQDELPFDGARRQFPVPVGNRPGPKRPLQVDLVVVADYAREDATFDEALSCLVAAARAGLKTAVFHWRTFELPARAPLRAAFYDACRSFAIDILAPGDNVEAHTILFISASILQHRISPTPLINARRVAVLVEDMIAGGSGVLHRPFDPAAARMHLNELFGTEGTWLATSPTVAARMNADQRFPRAHEQCWFPIVVGEDLYERTPLWRAGQRSRPVIGRVAEHSNAAWPSSRSALSQAYGVDQPFEVRLLGDVERAIRVLGEMPSNWSVQPSVGQQAAPFIAELDVYVHFPHEHTAGTIDRSVLHAMALGVPAIVPAELADVFGSAAVCVGPQEVAARVGELWQSKQAYMARARAGRDFVRRNHDAAAIIERLAWLDPTT